MSITAFSLNEIGGRKNVEDAIMPKSFNAQQPKLFIVCDGVGGSSFGEVASELATKSYYEKFATANIQSESEFKNLLHESLKFFQQRVADFIEGNPSAAGTSTTLTLLALSNDKAYLAWCGDSKIFHLRNGIPVYKTQDHSLVAELVAQGVITEAEAESHPQRNIITRSLNANTKPTDVSTVILTDIKKEDWFLLCTDGLMEQFTESMFPAILGKFNASTNYSELIDKICYGKTKDNYSMYLVYINAAPAKGGSKMTLLLLLLLILSAGGWFAYSQWFNKSEAVTPNSIEEPEVKSIMMVKPADTDSSTSDTSKTITKDSIK